MRIAILAAALSLAACSAPEALTGPHGDRGPAGADGSRGERGADGAPGVAGKDGASGKDATRDGSRIKARWMVADDGARWPIGWRDEATAQACEWSEASDGKTRCLPAALDVAPFAPFLAWADPACSIALLGVQVEDATDEPPPVAAFAAMGGDLYLRINAPTAPASFYSSGTGACGAAATPHLQFFWSADALEASFFVSASAQ